jgi:hypothetical protein
VDENSPYYAKSPHHVESAESLAYKARALVRAKKYPEANAAYQSALQSNGNSLLYGRIIYEWGEFCASWQVIGGPVSLEVALARVARGLVLMEVDEHRAVSDVELNEARSTRRTLEAKIAQIGIGNVTTITSPSIVNAAA